LNVGGGGDDDDDDDDVCNTIRMTKLMCFGVRQYDMTPYEI